MEFDIVPEVPVASSVCVPVLEFGVAASSQVTYFGQVLVHYADAVLMTHRMHIPGVVGRDLVREMRQVMSPLKPSLDCSICDADKFGGFKKRLEHLEDFHFVILCQWCCQKFQRCIDLNNHPIKANCLSESYENKYDVDPQFREAAGGEDFKKLSLLTLQCTYDLCNARFFRQMALVNHVRKIHWKCRT